MCQKSACLEISDPDLLARSHYIRELLDVRDEVIDIPGILVRSWQPSMKYVSIDSFCALFAIFARILSYIVAIIE